MTKKKQIDSHQQGTGYLHKEPSVKDFRAEEVFSSLAPVTWVEKPQSAWKRFSPIRNQNQSSACVAYTTQLLLAVENLLEEKFFPYLSPRTIYARGFVAPGGGMYYDQAFAIAKDYGATLETLLPSEGLTEEQMRKLDDEKESMRLIGKIFRAGKGYVYLPINIDAIAAILDTGKVVGLGTRFNDGGFMAEIKLDPNGKYGHAVTVVDRTLWKGEKALIIQNSWGDQWGFNGLGVITESEMKKGVVAALYFQDFANAVAPTKPHIVITVKEIKPNTNSGEVVKLQLMLQLLGFFPTNIDTTGFYGGITMKAVKDYQTARLLVPTGIADALTVSKLNSEF